MAAIRRAIEVRRDAWISQPEVPPWPYERTMLLCTDQKWGGKINVTGQTGAVNKKTLLLWVDA